MLLDRDLGKPIQERHGHAWHRVPRDGDRSGVPHAPSWLRQALLDHVFRVLRPFQHGDRMPVELGAGLRHGDAP